MAMLGSDCWLPIPTLLFNNVGKYSDVHYSHKLLCSNTAFHCGLYHPSLSDSVTIQIDICVDIFLHSQWLKENG